MRPLPRGLVWSCLCWIVVCGSVHGAANDWAEGSRGSDGATRDYYNRAGYLKWNNYMGDWRDADNVAQGKKPYATANVVDNDKGRYIEWNVTPLVREWISRKYQNQGMFLRNIEGRGTIVFHSRESNDESHRPRLVLTTDKGTVALLPQADTYLERSTFRSQGKGPNLRVSGSSNHILLRFDPDDVKKTFKLRKAVLKLFTHKQYGSAVVGVFRCSQGHDGAPTLPKFGLAAKYPGDQGITKDPDVVFFADFESEKWDEEWTQVAVRKRLKTLAKDARFKFAPLQGKSLRVQIAKGSTTALNTLYKFKKQIGKEPEEIYFRYYLRLAPDWNQTLQGGKLPGISGTYGKAGWGGRKSRGIHGWSARGHFALTIPKDNPLGGLHPIGTYCYHADMKGHYGDTWIWQNGYHGFLTNNQWYCIEQHLKMNTPGKKDGILRAWVDGRLAFEKADIRFRHVPKLKIEQIWMNVYHGGRQPSPYDQHLFIDNIVIAGQYIGPMRKKITNKE